MKKLSILILLTACIGLMQSCKDDDSTCPNSTFNLNPDSERTETFENMDTMTFRREQNGIVDTIMYTQDTTIEDYIVANECPDFKRNLQRNSFRYKSLKGEELVIELVQIPLWPMMTTFINDKVLYTNWGAFDSSITLGSLTFESCTISRDDLMTNNEVGYSEKVIIDGDIDINGQGENTSRSYFNLNHGLVFMSLYENTDSLLTFQRIL